MFTVGDSVMFQGEMRTLYAVTNTTATISVENAHDPTMTVPLNEISRADWNPPDTFLVSELNILVRIYNFLQATVAAGAFLRYPEMPENVLYDLLATRSSSYAMETFMKDMDMSFARAEELLDEWATYLNKTNKDILRWGIIRRVETIAGVCADHFSQVFDTETLITFIRQPLFLWRSPSSSGAFWSRNIYRPSRLIPF